MSTMKDFTFVGLNELIPNGQYQVLFVPDGWTPPVEGSGAGYKHTQNDASTVWDITHNLGFDPGGIVVLGNNGDIYHPTIEYLVAGVSVRLNLPNTISGTAYLS